MLVSAVALFLEAPVGPSEFVGLASWASAEEFYSEFCFGRLAFVSPGWAGVAGAVPAGPGCPSAAGF